MFWIVSRISKNHETQKEMLNKHIDSFISSTSKERNQEFDFLFSS